MAYDSTKLKTENIDPELLQAALNGCIDGIDKLTGKDTFAADRLRYHMTRLLDMQQAMLNPESCDPYISDDDQKTERTDEAITVTKDPEKPKKRKEWSEEARAAAAERMRVRFAHKKTEGVAENVEMA